MGQPYVGQAKCVIKQIEREYRYQAGKSNETPAFFLYTRDQLPRAVSHSLRHPVIRDVTRGQKGQCCTDCSADQII